MKPLSGQGLHSPAIGKAGKNAGQLTATWKVQVGQVRL